MKKFTYHILTVDDIIVFAARYWKNVCRMMFKKVES